MKIRVFFVEEDFEIMQRGADFLIPKLKTKIDMKKYVTNKYVMRLY